MDRRFLASSAVVAALGSAALGAVVAAPAMAQTCSGSGLTPKVSGLTALGGATCQTARKLPSAALKAANKQNRFNTKAVQVDGFTCNVLKFAANNKLFGGHCTLNHHTSEIVDWKFV